MMDDANKNLFFMMMYGANPQTVSQRHNVEVDFANIEARVLAYLGGADEPTPWTGDQIPGTFETAEKYCTNASNCNGVSCLGCMFSTHSHPKPEAFGEWNVVELKEEVDLGKTELWCEGATPNSDLRNTHFCQNTGGGLRSSCTGISCGACLFGSKQEKDFDKWNVPVPESVTVTVFVPDTMDVVGSHKYRFVDVAFFWDMVNEFGLSKEYSSNNVVITHRCGEEVKGRVTLWASK